MDWYIFYLVFHIFHILERSNAETQNIYDKFRRLSQRNKYSRILDLFIYQNIQISVIPAYVHSTSKPNNTWKIKFITM